MNRREHDELQKDLAMVNSGKATFDELVMMKMLVTNDPEEVARLDGMLARADKIREARENNK